MKILVVAAHPDDEVLGVGGTVLRHTRAGDEVYSVIVGEGGTSRFPRREGAERLEIAALQTCARCAAKVLGAYEPEFLGLPDNRLDSLDLLDVIKPVEDIIVRMQPEIIYTHYRGDLNIDHRIVHEAVRTAARPLPGSTVRAIYCFETVSSTEWGADAFVPQRYVDISVVLPDKISALSCYEREMRPAPHARSMEAIEALARARGASAGMRAAEAFIVTMELERVR